jgi:hypothetical protein
MRYEMIPERELRRFRQYMRQNPNGPPAGKTGRMAFDAFMRGPQGAFDSKLRIAADRDRLGYDASRPRPFQGLVDESAARAVAELERRKQAQDSRPARRRTTLAMRPVASWGGSHDLTMAFDQQHEEEGESAGLSIIEGQQGQGHRNVPQSLRPIAEEGHVPVQADEEERTELKRAQERAMQRAKSMDDWSGSHRPAPQRAAPTPSNSALGEEPEDDAETGAIKDRLSAYSDLSDDELKAHALELTREARKRQQNAGSQDRRRRARDTSPPPQPQVETTGGAKDNEPPGPPPFEGRHMPGGAMDSSARGFASRFPEAARLRPNDPSWT